jgi:hypothetical protein
MLWSFSIWAALHILAKGNLAGLIFFGAFLVTSLVGMPSIDSKLAARAAAALGAAGAGHLHPALRRHPRRAQRAGARRDPAPRLDRRHARLGGDALAAPVHLRLAGLPPP